jgi:PhnB protein
LGTELELSGREHMTSINITAHIVVPDADAAAGWYQSAFGATIDSRIPLPDGRALSVVLRFGESLVHAGTEFPDFGIVAPATLGGTATVLQIATENADALWQRAIDAGAEAHHPLADQFWGERHGQLVDPFGHRWNIAQHLRDVSDEELAAGAAAAFGG